MAKHTFLGASIECHGAEIISRKILYSSYIEILNIGKCKTYKCTLNSEATIHKELPHPKTPKYKETSCITEGDIIEGENITLFVNNDRNIKISVINHSGSHKAQQSNTNCYTYAVITLQCKGIPALR